MKFFVVLFLLISDIVFAQEEAFAVINEHILRSCDPHTLLQVFADYPLEGGTNNCLSVTCNYNNNLKTTCET